MWFEPQFAEFVGEWSTFGSDQFEDLRLATRSRFPLRLDRGEGQGEVSNSIHIQSIASRSREIAPTFRKLP